MGFPIIPLAVVGTALGSLGAYLYVDDKVRHRIVEEGRHLADTVTGYVTGLFAGRQTAVVEGANVITTALHEPDRERCEALTKSGKRCRAKTSKVLAIQDELGRKMEYGLCWRHAKVHEEGAALALSSHSAPEPGTQVLRH